MKEELISFFEVFFLTLADLLNFQTPLSQQNKNTFCGQYLMNICGLSGPLGYVRLPEACPP